MTGQTRAFRVFQMYKPHRIPDQNKLEIPFMDLRLKTVTSFQECLNFQSFHSAINSLNFLWTKVLSLMGLDFQKILSFITQYTKNSQALIKYAKIVYNGPEESG